MPIFGVRGANSAFEDADNLAWKIALILKGVADDELLQSYAAERVYAARENLHQGMKSTEFMSPPSFGFDLMRTAVLGLAIKHSFVRPLINPRQTQAVRYANSTLNGPSVGEFGAGPAPGCVAHECPLTRERPSHASSLIAWDHTGRLFPMYEAATPGTVYLVRPDGHVLARWRHATPENIHSAIKRALHASSSQSKESA